MGSNDRSLIIIRLRSFDSFYLGAGNCSGAAKKPIHNGQKYALYHCLLLPTGAVPVRP
jgi:hypothetical protein